MVEGHVISEYRVTSEHVSVAQGFREVLLTTHITARVRVSELTEKDGEISIETDKHPSLLQDDDITQAISEVLQDWKGHGLAGITIEPDDIKLVIKQSSWTNQGGEGVLPDLDPQALAASPEPKARYRAAELNKTRGW